MASESDMEGKDDTTAPPPCLSQAHPPATAAPQAAAAAEVCPLLTTQLNPMWQAQRKGSLVWSSDAPKETFSTSVLLLDSRDGGGGFIVPGTASAAPAVSGSKEAAAEMSATRTRRAITVHQVPIGAERSSTGFGSVDDVFSTPYSTVTLYIMLAMAAMVGSLVRVECNVFSKHDMFAIYPRLYANIFGCLLMGPLVMYKARLVSEHYPIYIALGVGFCGSLTSFSSWQTEGTMALVRWSDSYSDDRFSSVGDQIIGSITVQIVGIATSTAALSFGMLATQVFSAKDYEFDAPKPMVRAVNVKDMKFIVASLAVISLLLSTHFSHLGRQEEAYTMLFAPAGVFLRHGLSRRLNTGRSWFPWGTFTANCLATFVTALAVIYATHWHESLSEDERSCLRGLVNGLCGCLSTVSTWVFELRTLATVPTRSIQYATSSIVAAQAILILTVGIYRWSHGFNDPYGGDE
eukprot:CAMPEP_0182940170 /NCGR_PEP_ID=MMETSP0105_2-20130417/46862_1 /TAXON_ID=81532 ORGANISM="Acanthoeca-like sp., Strain 10tr" /NCGR_SAMPLE_ID=MMETSP0105_2 /ASSEMBLY_ACC=CAM_ASM_000205 /LENGTH=462 /DNA_ID=CAMNT_0025079639 /DNA_START=16 /DNA_END=1404 /DNA_ORIENTATION=-